MNIDARLARLLAVLLFVIMVFLLSGCAITLGPPLSYYQSEREEYLKSHPNDIYEQQIRNRQTVIGMNFAQVKAAWFLYYDRRPKVIASGTSRHGATETWRIGKQYLRFRDGILINTYKQGW